MALAPNRSRITAAPSPTDRRRRRAQRRHPVSGLDSGDIVPDTTVSSDEDLPTYDFRIDLRFEGDKLVFQGENLPVAPDGSFTVKFPSLGVTRRILFVCDPNDPVLSLQGIRVAQPGRGVMGAPLHKSSGPIDSTPFSAEIAKRYILLTDTLSQEASQAWPYCLAFQHGTLKTEQDPEILNEGDADNHLEHRRRARWLRQRRSRRRPVFCPR